MDIRIITTGTPEYNQMIKLRMKILLDPIGIPRSYIDPEKEKEDILIGAFDGEEMRGCCILTMLHPSTIQLRQMAVDTFHQKKGVGTAIVSFAEAFCKDKGCQKIIMHARDAALHFYRRCGYSVSGTRFFEVGIGHHKMEKELL